MPLLAQSPYLGFFFIVKDHVLGSRRRRWKRSIIRKFWVTLHNPCSRNQRRDQKDSHTQGWHCHSGLFSLIAHQIQLGLRVCGLSCYPRSWIVFPFLINILSKKFQHLLPEHSQPFSPRPFQCPIPQVSKQMCPPTQQLITSSSLCSARSPKAPAPSPEPGADSD